MKIAYSDRLRANYLILEHGEETTVDEVFRIAEMHRATKRCCGGARSKVALARTQADGSVEREHYESKGILARRM
jgi:hypothetical protein